MKSALSNSHMNFTAITDDCLERIAHGESVADCLARYPDVAEQLAPMLWAAEQLRAFSQVHLTEGQRLRAKVALREELAAQRAQRERSKGALGIVAWARLRMAPLAAAVAAVLFVSVAFSTVAASQPGDFVYPVRVAVERAPALVQSNPARGAAVELAVADRRLSDITRDGAAHAVAVDALLRSDEAAVERAVNLSETEKDEVAARVSAHAATLSQLANQAANPAVAGRLRNAADEALALVGRSRSVVVGADETATATVAATATSTRTSTSTRTVTATSSPQPSATRMPPTVRPAGGLQTPSPVATRVRPALSVTPPRLPSRTPYVPNTSTPKVKVRTPLPVTPPPHQTPKPRATISAVPPTAAAWRTPNPTVRVLPTVFATLTRMIPTDWPRFVTPTPGHASVNTPTATSVSWWSTPTASTEPPTAVPTAVVNTPQATPTRVWSQFTPEPTATPRPGGNSTATTTPYVPVYTPVYTPQLTRTPRWQWTSTPAPSATPGDGGNVVATPTELPQPSATPEPASTPPLPR